MYYNARYYDASIGRFAQPDSIIPNLYDPQSLNRYTYVRNNPIKSTDPTGHCGPLTPVCVAVAEFVGSEVAEWVAAGAAVGIFSITFGAGPNAAQNRANFGTAMNNLNSSAASAVSGSQAAIDEMGKGKWTDRKQRELQDKPVGVLTWSYGEAVPPPLPGGGGNEGKVVKWVAGASIVAEGICYLLAKPCKEAEEGPVQGINSPSLPAEKGNDANAQKPGGGRGGSNNTSSNSRGGSNNASSSTRQASISSSSPPTSSTNGWGGTWNRNAYGSGFN